MIGAKTFRPAALVLVGLLLLLLTRAARGDLPADLNAALADPALRSADVGVTVVALGDAPADDKVIYAKQPDKPLIPASNLKLVTAAAALDVLGADFKFRSVLAAKGSTLALVGDGDPTTGDAELLKPLGWDITTVFQRWADVLRGGGLASVQDVVVDDSIFDEDFLHPNWPRDQASKSYVPQVAGVNLNANLLDLHLTADGPGQGVTCRFDPPTDYATVASNSLVYGDKDAVHWGRILGTNRIVLSGETDARDQWRQVTIDDPAMYAATVMADTFRSHGIAIGGSVKRDRGVRDALKNGGGGWRVVAVVETPLPTVLTQMNKQSINLYAEALCKRMGAATAGAPGTWENGTAAMGAYLKKLGVPNSEFSFDGGSGLSRENRVSASAMVAVLAAAYHGPHADVMLESLSVAGTDGTLKNRFGEPSMQSLRGRVFGKSGYVNNVSTLSGYLHGRDGKWYAFSVLVNDVTDIGRAKWVQQSVVRAVDEASK